MFVLILIVLEIIIKFGVFELYLFVKVIFIICLQFNLDLMLILQ